MRLRTHSCCAALLFFAACCYAPLTVFAQQQPHPPGMQAPPPPPHLLPPPPPPPPALAPVATTPITNEPTPLVAEPAAVAVPQPAQEIPVATASTPTTAAAPWPDAEALGVPQNASAPTVATPPLLAQPTVVERIVTREVTRWPWWLALVVLAMALAWWQSQRKAARLNAETVALERQQRHLKSAHRQLRERAEQLQQTAVQDGLTGTMTRQAFASEFEAALAHAAHFGKSVALLIFDLDHFKDINDAHGHAAGDAALKLVTGIVREKLTSSDLFGRFGGDEFMIGSAGCDEPEALQLAEEIRASLDRHVRENRAQPSGLSLSIGVAVADPESGYDLDRLFNRADAALYSAKRTGRNRAVLAGRELPHIGGAQAPRSLAKPA